MVEGDLQWYSRGGSNAWGFPGRLNKEFGSYFTDSKLR
jgi:hypothetical protein